MSENRLIYQQMANVMKDLDAIPKNKSGSGINYKFRGIDDFMNTLNPVMAKHGVVLSFEILDRECYTKEITTKQFDKYSNSQVDKLSIWTTVLLKMKYIFFAKDGSSISCETIGEGKDNSDKAHNKAMSVALKYALMQIFLVPTEDLIDQDAERPLDNNQEDQQKVNESNQSQPKNPENHAPQTQGGISPAQLNRLYAIGKAANKSIADINTHVKMAYSLDNPMGLNKKQYDEICSFYQNKK